MAPMVKTLLSYIKDSQHALISLAKTNLFSYGYYMDITVIPNDEGLRASKHFFDQRNVKEPSSETLLRLAELVLTLNCFSEGGNKYKQTKRVAIDTTMGLSYANLLLGFIKHQFFSPSYTTASNLNSTVATLTTASVLPPLPEKSSLNL